MAGGIVVSPEITLHSLCVSHIRYRFTQKLAINIAGYAVVLRAFPWLASGGIALAEAAVNGEPEPRRH